MFRTVMSKTVKSSAARDALTGDEQQRLHTVRRIVLPLHQNRHKGQAGRIGIVGGSADYTGAPFFAAMSALRVGMDLAHVFCAGAAAPIIKAYSPELIVHPVLDRDDAVAAIEPWLPRLHALIIGPGLGRDAAVFGRVAALIEECRRRRMPLIIDADALVLIGQRPELVNAYEAGCILTPNVAELVHCQRVHGCTVLQKGPLDTVWRGDGVGVETLKCLPGGSGRRCGGQGDVLSGAVAAFYVWARLAEAEVPSQSEQASLACQAGSFLTRKCNERAFARHGRGMLASDMLAEVTAVFGNYFEDESGGEKAQ